jgi:hypothetical protein
MVTWHYKKNDLFLNFFFFFFFVRRSDTSLDFSDVSFSYMCPMLIVTVSKYIGDNIFMHVNPTVHKFSLYVLIE